MSAITVTSASQGRVQQVRGLARTSESLVVELGRHDAARGEAHAEYRRTGGAATARYAALLNGALEIGESGSSLRRMIEVEVECTDRFFHAIRPTSALAQRTCSCRRPGSSESMFARRCGDNMADRLGSTSLGCGPVVQHNAFGIETRAAVRGRHGALLSIITVRWADVPGRATGRESRNAGQRSGN